MLSPVVNSSDSDYFARQEMKRQVATKIVLVDDEDWSLDFMEMLLRDWCKEAIIMRFQNRADASQELLRADPDLLITDMRNDNVPGRVTNFGMSGFELLRHLAMKGAPYPILAVSGCFAVSGLEGLAKQCAGRRLRISFLTKPFSPELFKQGLLKSFGLAGNALKE